MRFAGPIIYGGIGFLFVSLIVLNILIPHHGLFRRHPTLRALMRLVPFAYPVLCWALFSIAASHDRRTQDDLKMRGDLATATVTSLRDAVVGAEIFSAVALRLRVTPTGGAAFDAELAVDPTESPVGAPSVGSLVRVLYDPSDQSRLMLAE